jgi:hypothetical protein
MIYIISVEEMTNYKNQIPKRCIMMNTANVANDSITMQNQMNMANVDNDEFTFVQINEELMICTVLGTANKDKVAEAINVGLYNLEQMDRIDSQWDCNHAVVSEGKDIMTMFIRNLMFHQPK